MIVGLTIAHTNELPTLNGSRGHDPFIADHSINADAFRKGTSVFSFAFWTRSNMDSNELVGTSLRSEAKLGLTGMCLERHLIIATAC